MSQKENLSSVFKVGSIAAFLAALSLIVTITAFVMAGSSVEGVEQLLAQIDNKTKIFTIAFAAVALISLFDIFTVPGLYFATRAGQHTFALLGSILAVVGDTLGLASGVIQSALLRLSATYAAASGAEQMAIVSTSQLVDTLESAFSIAGFLLVGASFIFFGLAMLKNGFSKWIGWVGIVAGLLTIAGLLPSLLLLSLGANILYLVWYVGIGVKFYRLAV